MNAYQHKHTGEIRAQEFSPGDDWEIIVKPDWVDGLCIFIAAVAVIALVCSMNDWPW